MSPVRERTRSYFVQKKDPICIGVILEELCNVAKLHVRANLNKTMLINSTGGVAKYHIPNARSRQYKLYRAVAGYLGAGVFSIFQLVFESAEVEGCQKDHRLSLLSDDIISPPVLQCSGPGGTQGPPNRYMI